MDSGNAIEVRNIKKNFKIYYDKGFELKERILFRKRNRYELREVLRGISFDVKRGEAIGLVGKNGCGKSTTLKMINRIMYPDSGTIKVNGRVSSLIELGAGFHPDMSGRENIYTNASIYGLTKKEIDQRVDKIITFSELEPYIENPVRTYSSGMYMRLAFSVAINVDADILLIDEILGVGDVSFQTKCFEKLMDIKEKGTTIVIVSHSLEQIEQICDRSIWIENGLIREMGKPEMVHSHYLDTMEDMRQRRIEAEKNNSVEDEKEEIILPEFCCSNARRYGNYRMEFMNISVEDDKGNVREEFLRSENINISYEVDSKNMESDINIGYRLIREDGVLCYASDRATNIAVSGGECSQFMHIKEDTKGKIVIKNDNLLVEGSYYLDMVLTERGREVYDEICRVKEFVIKGRSEGIGIVELETEWVN